MSKNEKDESNEIEKINTGPTYFLEEDISIDEKYVKNKSLIRMDMNIVQFPIFSKNAKRKKNEVTTYYFNKNKDTFITIKPVAGELIPGEAEERVFIALMKLMKEKGMEQEFIVTAKEIREAAKINSNNYISEIKKSLLRLSETNYNFKNTMYSNELNSIIKDEVSTPILTFKSRQLNLEENKSLKDTVDDRRIREVYQIRISDHFYKNIVKRGYLVYDSNILLDIHSGVARTLYMLLEKIRFENLYVKESVFALIKKIPLKYEKKSLPMTIKTLERALNELLEKKLISGFEFFKPTTWQEADVEIFFNENHNSMKQERFAEDNKELKRIYNTLAISYTENKNIEEVELPGKIAVTPEMIKEILRLLPKKAETLKSMPETIRESIEIYGYQRVADVSRYIRKNKVEKIRAYLIKALKENWLIEETGNEIRSSEQTQESLREQEQTDYSLFDEFLRLNENEQEEIEKTVYEEYIKKCGIETKIQKNAYKLARKGLICQYLATNRKLIEKPQEKIDAIFLKAYIDKSIDMYKIILDLSEEKVMEIRKEISIELIPKIIKNSITMDEIDKILAEKIK